MALKLSGLHTLGIQIIHFDINESAHDKQLTFPHYISILVQQTLDLFPVILRIEAFYEVLQQNRYLTVEMQTNVTIGQ